MAYTRMHYEIFIPSSRLNKNIRFYFKEWNKQFWDEKGTFKRKGAKLFSDGHQNVSEAIVYLMINRISTWNRRNKASTTKQRLDVTKPITFMVNTNDIRNVMTKNLNTSISLRTIRNRIDRMVEAKILIRQFNKAEGRYLMHFSPFLLPIMNNEKGELLKNTNFLDVENQQLTQEQWKDLPNYIKNPFINKEINKEQCTIVDKRMDASIQENTLKQEQLKNKRTSEAISKTPSVHTRKYSRKIAKIFNIPPEKVKEISKDLENNLPNKEKINKADQLKNDFNRLRKNAAVAFYVRFIITFYSWSRSSYLPNSAGSTTIHFVEQAINELETNKDYYFGACKTVEHLEYQNMKLEMAMKSTLMNVTKKLKNNPHYNWKKNYPNLFLSKPPGKNSFSFKNSILHVEKSLMLNNKMNAEYEKAMTKQKIKLINEKEEKLIYTAVWYIYRNTNRTAQNIKVAMEYFKTDPDLRQKFKAVIMNAYAVKKFMKDNPNFEPDENLIADCFERHEIIREKINDLMPKINKKLIFSEKIPGRLGQYIIFAKKGVNSTNVVRNYDEETYNYLNNFVYR